MSQIKLTFCVLVYHSQSRWEREQSVIFIFMNDMLIKLTQNKSFGCFQGEREKKNGTEFCDVWERKTTEMSMFVDGLLRDAGIERGKESDKNIKWNSVKKTLKVELEIFKNQWVTENLTSSNLRKILYKKQIKTCYVVWICSMFFCHIPKLSFEKFSRFSQKKKFFIYMPKFE